MGEAGGFVLNNSSRLQVEVGPPRSYFEKENLPLLLLGTWEREQFFQGNLGIKSDSGEQFGISFKETIKNHFCE